MNIERSILLNHEYTIAKISGFWNLKLKISKLGIESYKKITFLKSDSQYYFFRIDNGKRIKKIPVNFLNYIQLIDSKDQNLDKKLKESLSEIRVDVFRSDITEDSAIFDKRSEYSYSDCNLKINYLPAVSSVYGDNYENKKLRNNVLTDFPDIFLGVIDYENLESDLCLVTQFMDMDAKIILALRNYEHNNENSEINFDLLSKLLGIPIIGYSEILNEENEVVANYEEVLKTILKTHSNPENYVRRVHVDYGREIEAKIAKVSRRLKKTIENNFYISPRYFAISLLEKDVLAVKAHEACTGYDRTKCTAAREISSLEKKYGHHIFSVLKDARGFYVEGAITEISTNKTIQENSNKFDKIFLHKFWGIPIFLLLLFITFYASFGLGKYPMQWLDSGIEWFSNYLGNHMDPGFWKDLIINGIIEGMGSVLVFLPNIFIFFFFIGILENTSYLSRVVFLMDKYMHKIGLHGKSFIPMIMGFGCSIPAILSTGMLESKRDRILTMLIIPFMSCSARLPIYILMISAFFPKYPALILFMIYGFGVLLAFIVSKFFSKTIFKKYNVPYVMELVPYRRPTLRILFGYMWNRGKEYLKNIGGIIIIASVIIWLLGYYPRNVEYSKNYDDLINKAKTEEQLQIIELEKDSEKHEKSYIGRIGKFIEPVMSPLGFDWKMSVSVLAGFAGKEITVSTMGVLYQAQNDNRYHTSSLQERLKAETYVSGPRAGQKVFNKVVALSFIMFILIYFPCIAIGSVIWKESKFKWALFSATYSTALAWIVSFVIFQVGSLLI